MNSPIRILLIDDSPHFLTAAQDFLQLHESFHVIGTARDGDEAVEDSSWLAPDVILLDLNLGTTSGLDCIPLLKQHLPQTKIIALTILPDEPYRALALQKGADAFVHKTVMSHTLVTVIHELAERPNDPLFENDPPPIQAPDPKEINP